MSALRRSGRLTLFEPELREHETHRRRLWMHPQVAIIIGALGGSPEDRAYFANVRALLRNFVVGDDMFDDDVVLKEVQPRGRGIWSMRITFEPQARMIGGFVRRGEFVASTMRSRHALEQGWGPAIARHRKIWSGLFGQEPSCEVRGVLLSEFAND